MQFFNTPGLSKSKRRKYSVLHILNFQLILNQHSADMRSDIKRKKEKFSGYHKK